MTPGRELKNSQAWCWQDKFVTRFIRDNYNKKRLTTCLAIYQSMTELASNSGSQNTFTAFYSQIAKLSGKSISTIKKYTKELIKLGLLKVENRKYDEKTNLSNRWILLTCSVQDNKPTLEQNIYGISDNNRELLLEKNKLEKNKIENDVFNSQGYIKSRQLIDSFKIKK